MRLGGGPSSQPQLWAARFTSTGFHPDLKLDLCLGEDTALGENGS